LFQIAQTADVQHRVDFGTVLARIFARSAALEGIGFTVYLYAQQYS